MRALIRLPLTLIITLTFYQLALAEEGILWVQVSNPQGQPIAGVVLSAAGPSSTSAPTEVNSQVTEVSGKARIKLAAGTRPADEVELVIVRAEQDLVFISPWNQRVTVPCFDNSTRCVAKVVLAERGSRMLLEYAPAQSAMAAGINASNALRTGDAQSTEEQRRLNLEAVAKAYGFKSEDVDRAIRALGEKTTDPYQLGLVALYERNYVEASKRLAASVEERKRNLAEAKGELADAQFFYGQTLYEQGRYREAARTYEQVAEFRPDDSDTLNWLGLALYSVADYGRAEEYYQQSLKLSEKQLGPEHPNVAVSLNNLAALYLTKGRYSEAEVLHKRALAISEKQLGPEHPQVAGILNNLAWLYVHQDRYSEAGLLFRRSLNILEKRLGREHPDVAASLKNLALFYSEQGKYAEAEPLVKRALTISEKQLGPEHPQVAHVLNEMAGLYSEQGNFIEAEDLVRRALTIKEKLLGPEHPDVAVSLNNLAKLYGMQGKFTEAEDLVRRALNIREKLLGPEHLSVATSLENLALLYRAQGKYAEAEPLVKRALAISEKKLGSDHPTVALILENYAILLRKLNRIAQAQEIEARAKNIRLRTDKQIQRTGQER
jgi:tetratricopeptide (TPR) repeat protein